jgi:beta-galactosidase
MKNSFIPILVFLLSSQLLIAQEPRKIINLNGIWEFDQTTKAFPPETFTRKIPVPGLIHLAEPRIE